MFLRWLTISGSAAFCLCGGELDSIFLLYIFSVWPEAVVSSLMPIANSVDYRYIEQNNHRQAYVDRLRTAFNARGDVQRGALLNTVVNESTSPSASKSFFGGAHLVAGCPLPFCKGHANANYNMSCRRRSSILVNCGQIGAIFLSR